MTTLPPEVPPATAAPFRFVTGGTVPLGSPSYVERPCDAQLLDLCVRGEFAYVLSSRQMGKSSLMARTTDALRARDVAVAAFDLNVLGTHQVNPEHWYVGVLTEICNAVQPDAEVFDWWEAHDHLPVVQRFTRYISDVLLQSTPRRIVVFVDEIDATLGLPFTDDFFAAIRSLHNARAQRPELARISFVLLGVATPGELIRDTTRTPFNIGTRVEISDFDAREAGLLVRALTVQPAAPAPLIDEILRWTGGQPYLTQRLCEALETQATSVGAVGSAGTETGNVTELVQEAFLSEKGRADPHFEFVSQYLIRTPREHKDDLFDTCRKLLKNKAVPCRDASVVHNRLRLAGYARKNDRQLQMRNQIYRRLFGLAWTKANRPTFWTQANKRVVAWSGAGMLAAMLVSVVLWTLYLKAEASATEAKAGMNAAGSHAALAEKDVQGALVAAGAALQTSPHGRPRSAPSMPPTPPTRLPATPRW